MIELPKKVFIYGTGDFSHRIALILNQLNIEVITFLEFEPGRIRENVRSPAEIELNQTGTVVIGLGNPEADIYSISKKLIHLGFKVVSPVEVAQYFFANNVNFENYWLSGDPQMFSLASERIAKARNLLKEQKSLDLFDKILDYRKNSLLERLPIIEPLSSQYMPTDLPWVSFNNPISVIDCGAYTGDTVDIFLKNGVIFENYFAFEPDSDNYFLLQEFISRNKLTNIFALNLATWSESLILKFKKSGQKNSGAHLTYSTTDDSVKVLAVKLDDLLSQQKIDLIKMDIEGAEIDTLLGLSETIKSNKPFLAISTYHKPTDLWEIPLLVAEVSKSYEFYFRVYGQQTFETVLYCVPTS